MDDTLLKRLDSLMGLIEEARTGRATVAVEQVVELLVVALHENEKLRHELAQMQGKT